MQSDQVQEALQGIRGALQPSNEQILLWVLIVGVLVIVPLFIVIFITARARQRRLQGALRRFHEILMQRGLSNGEQTLMERLEQYFQHDKSRLPELAHDPALFNGAARNMLEAEPEMEEAIARLRFKLGLILKNAFQAPHSTTELTPGMAVYLTLNGRTELNAMVSDVQDSCFYIQSSLPGRPGDTASMEFHSHAGVFRFRTRIKKIENNFFLFAHTEHIEQVQKRRYFRKKIELPVTLERATLKESAASYALDISGGGARVHNPGLDYRPGELITVVVFMGRREEAVIQARVIRLNQKDDSVSLSFDNITDTLRDRLVRLAR